MQVFNSFQEMQTGMQDAQPHLGVFNPEQVDCAVENNTLDVTVGGTPPVTPAQPVGDRKPIPEWGQSLDKRLTALEGKVERGFDTLERKIDEISSKLK